MNKIPPSPIEKRIVGTNIISVGHLQPAGKQLQNVSIGRGIGTNKIRAVRIVLIFVGVRNSFQFINNN